MDSVISSNRKSWLAQSIKKDTSMLKVRNEIPIVSLSLVRTSDQNRHHEGTLQMRRMWRKPPQRTQEHPTNTEAGCIIITESTIMEVCVLFFSAVRSRFCPTSGSLCCSQCFVNLSRGRWNWRIVNIVPSAVSQLVIKDVGGTATVLQRVWWWQLCYQESSLARLRDWSPRGNPFMDSSICNFWSWAA